ncbi:MAG: sulfurtransferase TusA family protein [Promethearchaeota archaeon]
MPKHLQLDAMGLVCPLSAAETRKSLKTMQARDILEVKGDFSPAMENVIRMAEKMGGKILEKESTENFFRVVIVKM